MAESLHLLAMAQPFLGAPAISDVGCNSPNADPPAISTSNRESRHQNHVCGAIPKHDLGFFFDDPVVVEHRHGSRLVQPGDTRRKHLVGPTADDLACTSSVPFLELPVDHQVPALQVVEGNERRRVVYNLAQASFTPS